jgi:hypothetical protein
MVNSVGIGRKPIILRISDPEGHANNSTTTGHIAHLASRVVNADVVRNLVCSISRFTANKQANPKRTASATDVVLENRMQRIQDTD